MLWGRTLQASRARLMVGGGEEQVPACIVCVGKRGQVSAWA